MSTSITLVNPTEKDVWIFWRWSRFAVPTVPNISQPLPNRFRGRFYSYPDTPINDGGELIESRSEEELTGEAIFFARPLLPVLFQDGLQARMITVKSDPVQLYTGEVTRLENKGQKTVRLIVKPKRLSSTSPVDRATYTAIDMTAGAIAYLPTPNVIPATVDDYFEESLSGSQWPWATVSEHLDISKVFV